VWDAVVVRGKSGWVLAAVQGSGDVSELGELGKRVRRANRVGTSTAEDGKLVERSRGGRGG
jgi:hypothetical protein